MNRIRRALNRPPVWRYGLVVGGVFVLVAISIGAPALFRAIIPPESSDPGKSLAWLFILAALVVGYFLGFVLYSFISLAVGTFGIRTFRLLLECWEALHPAEDREECSQVKTWGVQPLSVSSTEPVTQGEKPLRIFGMRIWPEQPTDEQFVRKLRKSLPKLRLVCRLLKVVGGLLSTGLVIFAFSFARFLGSFFILRSRVIFYATFAAGMILGLAIGFAVNSIGLFFAGLFETQSDRLLVKCWDALHSREHVTNQ